MRVIGLTGGIASGKSTVARIIAATGIPVIDADQLAREVVLPGGPTLKEIAALCGSSVLLPDGTLNRAATAEAVFSNPALRLQLEEIMHPAIKALAEARLAALRAAGTAVVIYMAPLLIEAGATDRVDEVWVVFVEREAQLQRLMARDNISRSAAESRLAAQMPMTEKRQHARLVIDNNGTEAELEARVLEICRHELGVGQTKGEPGETAPAVSKAAADPGS